MRAGCRHEPARKYHQGQCPLRGARAQELCESRGGRPGFLVPNSPYGLCGRKATLNLNLRYQAELWIWSCVNVEVAVLGSQSPIVLIINYGLCGCVEV